MYLMIGRQRTDVYKLAELYRVLRCPVCETTGILFVYLHHINNDSSAFLNSDGGILLTRILDNGESLSVRRPCRDYRLAVNRTIKRTKRIRLNWFSRPGSKMRLYSNLLKVRGRQSVAEDLKIIYLIQSTFRLWPAASG